MENERKKLRLPEGFPFAYETHLHTSEGSKCGRSTGAEMAVACKEAGYAGIIVTDHFYYGNTMPDRSLPWSDWVEAYCKGYENAKKKGEEIGLNVMFGWESSYQGTDFLIYGLDKKWLLAHPEIKDATIEEQYNLVHKDGGLIIHAHPFREASYIPEIRLFPDYVDGVETINTAHEVRNSLPDGTVPYNELALAYAKEHDFPETCGSDIHSVDLFGGGMAFSHPIDNIKEYIAAVLKREGKLLSNKNFCATIL